MCKKGSAIGSGWEVDSVDAVAPSWTHSWNMWKRAAPPKPREDTTHTFTLWSAARNLQTWALLPNPEGSPLRNPGGTKRSVAVQTAGSVEHEDSL